MTAEGEPGGNTLEVVTRRWEFLDLLAEDACRTSEIAERLGCSRSTARRAVDDLVGAGLVRRRDGAYEATEAGALVADCYRACLDAVDDVAAAGPVLSALPSGAIGKAAVVGADIHQANDSLPYGPLREVQSLLEGADRVRATLPVLPTPRLLNWCRDCAEAGAAVELVVAEELYEALDAESQADPTPGADAVEVLTGAVPPFGLFLVETDDGGATVATVVCAENGGVAGVLVNDDPAAVQWATERYAIARSQATDPETGETAGEGAAAGVVRYVEGLIEQARAIGDADRVRRLCDIAASIAGDAGDRVLSARVRERCRAVRDD